MVLGRDKGLLQKAERLNDKQSLPWDRPGLTTRTEPAGPAKPINCVKRLGQDRGVLMSYQYLSRLEGHIFTDMDRRLNQMDAKTDRLRKRLGV